MAEYTSVTLADCSKLLEPYGWRATSAVPLKGGVANSSFRVSREGGDDVVLTVLDNHTPSSAAQLVELTDWLIDAKIITPPILRTLDGDAVGEFAGLPSIVRPFLTGEQPTVLDANQACEVGAVLGRLHSLAPPPKLALTTRRLPVDWRDDVLGVAPEDLIEMLDAAVELLEISDSTVSLIHGDLFPDNMIWTSTGKLVLLDWETASVDWALLDLGFTAVGLARGGPLSPTIERQLLRGYAISSGMEPSEEAFTAAARYACAVLMFHRFSRHVIRYPDPARYEHWRELVPFMETTSGIS